MSRLTLSAIIGEVAEITGVPAPAITGRRSSNRVSHARYLAIAAFREEFSDWSLTETGDQFGLDHTTIIHARKRHRELLTTDPLYHTFARQVCQRLFSGPRP